MGLCILCGSEYPDGGESKLIHESGKRHQKAVERHSQAVELTKKSVFVALISKHNNHSDGNVVNSAFGEVSRATCGYLNDHAFVEFLSEDAVQKAKAAKTIKITDVIQRVNDSGCSGFFEQIDLIASCIGITQTEISRREAFRERFETLLCQYIENPNVVQFGSALTGVGTNDSDVDLCLLFRKDGSSPMNEFLRDENELMSCQVKNFRENRLHCEELCALSIRDQTDLIFRILKDIRSEMSGFFKSLYVVSDARCPVIRFWSYNRHMVELSVSNGIGYQKSSYIGAVIQADQSGLLRKLVLGLRFWAISNGIFTSEKKKTWNLNSYTFTLMFFVYLQYEKVLPVFSHSDVEEYMNDVRVDFVVPCYSLFDIDIRKVFKNFFVLCVDSPLEKLVFSMRNGRLTPLDKISEKWNLKPNSVLFVQALRTMRHVMMLSLAAMKQDADSFAVMLRVLRTNTASISPMTNFPPMGTDFLIVVLNGSCRISGLPRDFDECAAETVLSIVLCSVLRCENVPPPAKRARFECEAADLGFFVVYKRLWMSRRTLRKKWTCILGKDEQFPLLIESLVSISLDETTKNDCCLQFQTFFELFNDSLWVGLKLIEGDAVDIGNFAHFTEQLLTKLRDFLASNNAGATLPILEDYTSLVRKVFERDRFHLKL
ncbi:unnamed protein product [Angiostrongylus costaricensis]|uniref:NTP_transf_2 domain-containing protein n=1 Tax=Angiostrongylus costaricensis TaxID=334426 RepID=A0A158PHL1_ANGCS|nr:unnamed protein product [Angiostrongylus costaricensis]